MNKALIKKRLILLFAIILPLFASFLIGNYGYKSKKFGQGAWYNEFHKIKTTEFFSFEEDFTTRDMIHRALKFGVSYYILYDEEPVYSSIVKNNDGEDLFILEIYRAIFQILEDGKYIDRIQYIYTFYDMQYLKLREAFDVDSNIKLQIEKSNVPEIFVTIYKLNENGDAVRDQDREIGMVTFLNESTGTKEVIDYEADVDYKQGYSGTKKKETDKLVIVPLGIHRVVDPEWSITDKVLVEVTATVNDVMDEDNKAIETLVASFEVEDYISDAKDIDVSNYNKSYKQDAKNIANYFAWVFKKYLWWISLIAFLIVGFITFSFYFAWVAEETKKQQQKKIKKQGNKYKV